MDFLSLKSNVEKNNLHYFYSLTDIERSCLISKKFYISPSSSQDTLLHVACRHGRQQILTYLVPEVGLQTEISNKDFKRATHEAAQFSELACLKTLLQNGAQVDPLKRADW